MDGATLLLCLLSAQKLKFGEQRLLTTFGC
jgi:hypothetical protein